ncbi:DUF4340 domain-containing protein [Horticoccus luteus]|uniref:DUF4340 domain-containing protein n=1 Tax=Horticoccus luteus TaxID=2862869 RepID=A0A8F9TXY5_9BACT|nr:DUF4340 domain-containing protein [Horticoccus luteus]QYM80046.1 DUF4340 domain-containing protein [Horticoccus luteus]
MRTKVTLVLIFLNVALFFFIFNFERGWRTERASLEARRLVLGPEAADIRSLEITSTNPARNVSLQRRADGWYLTSPIDWPANPNAVSRILNELQFLEHETSFAVKDLAQNNQSLADYGLDHPSLTVRFTSGDSTAAGGAAKPITLLIGDATNVGNRLYVLSPDGQRVHVVSRTLADSLSIPADQLRAETIFTIPVFEVRSLNLQTAPPANLRIRIRRDGNRWSFETPILTRASKSATELAINSLNALRVVNFLPRGSTENAPAANPSLRLTLEGNSRRETLLLGDPVSAAAATSTQDSVEYYAQLEDRNALFTVKLPRPLLDTLRNAQETLRERRLLDFDPNGITAVTISAPNQPDLVLQRDIDASAWQLVRRAAGGSQTQPADPKLVQRLLEQLTHLSAQRSADGSTSGFVSDAPSAADLENWGFNRPEREITLTTAAATGINPAPPLPKLQIGTSGNRDGRAYARLANAPFVYLVDPEILPETTPDPLHYRDRLLRALPPGARLTAITLKSLPDGAVIYSRELKPDEKWAAALASETDARRTAVQTLLDQLRTLRAREFVLDSFPTSVFSGGENRPWKYELTATISLVGGVGGEQASTTTLDLTERIGGTTQLAGSAEFGAVFAVEQPFLDALWTLTYGSRDPGPSPAPKP